MVDWLHGLVTADSPVATGTILLMDFSWLYHDAVSEEDRAEGLVTDRVLGEVDAFCRPVYRVQRF